MPSPAARDMPLGRRPANTPRDVVSRLNAEFVKVLRDPAVRNKLAAEGSEVAGGSPEQFGDYIRAELERWGKVVKVANVRVE